MCVCLAGLTREVRAQPSDAVAQFQAKLDSGKARLEHDAGQGYLVSLLRELNVPVSSQTLVFSKTSFQRDQISPQAPRALYFNDDVYVGWVKGGDVLEIASADPEVGTAFYTLDQRRAEKPAFAIQTDRCTQCHSSPMTGDVPGLILRSVHTDATGMPVLTAGTSLITQASPLEERWGGWYVTGTHGERRHKGNVTAKHRDDTGPLDVEAGANLTTLADRFDTSDYLTGHSDIVALMVLEHQAEAHNLITRLSQQTRAAVRDSKAINDAIGKPGSAELTDSARRRVESAGENLVRYLLFCDEELLTDPIAGTSTFTSDFAARGPHDKQGRSLREFDLRRKIFRYPLSYLIYSRSFDGLPDAAKQYVYLRIWAVLSGKDDGAAFKHISTQDRHVIVEILRETKPGLPDYFRAPR